MKQVLPALLAAILASCQDLPKPEEAFERGNVLLDAGDAAGAIDAYTLAIEQHPKFARAYNNRGLAHAALKDYAAAVADYDGCLALPAPFAEAYYNRGVAVYRLGRKGEAVLDFSQAIRLHPQYARAFAGRGLVFAAGGDKQSALADYRKALELAPTDWNERKSVEAEIARLSAPPK